MAHLPATTRIAGGGLVQFGGIPSTVADAPRPSGFVAPPVVSQGTRVSVPAFAPFTPTVPTFAPQFAPFTGRPVVATRSRVNILPPGLNPGGPTFVPGQLPGGIPGPTGFPGSQFAPGAIGTLAPLGCDFLPVALQAACRAAAGIVFPQTPTGPTGPALPQFPGTGNGFSPGAGAPGLAQPTQVAVAKLQCPRMGNGKIGILWMSKMDGTIVCLPRGVSGAQFGLQRKNKPPTKPMFTGGDVNCLRRVAGLQKQFKKAAKLFDMTTHHRGRGR